MNKSELVKALADQANISLDEATLVVNTFVDSMKVPNVHMERGVGQGFRDDSLQLDHIIFRQA